MARPIKHGTKWRIRWVDENGRRNSEVYDERRDAAAKLKEHEHRVEQTRRALRSPFKPGKVFGDVCDYWLSTRAKLKRSGKDDESIIRRHLRPFVGDKCKLTDITVEVAERYMVSRAHLDKKTIANHLTLLISMLNAAVDLGWLEKVPRIRKPRVRLFGKDFHYLRTEDEIRRFLQAAHDEGENVYALYATAVYTGMREGELAGLRREDIDFKQRLITVQRSFDGPTKAEDVRYLPLLDALLPALRAWMLRNPGSIVFPNEAGRMYTESARIFQEVLHRVLDAAGFPQVFRRGKLRPYIVFHDTRHTFASHWVMRGGDIFKLQKILGHRSIQMTQRYAHLAPAAYQSEYGRLGDGVSVTSGEVIPFPTPAL